MKLFQINDFNNYFDQKDLYFYGDLIQSFHILMFDCMYKYIKVCLTDQTFKHEKQRKNDHYLIYS